VPGNAQGVSQGEIIDGIPNPSQFIAYDYNIGADGAGRGTSWTPEPDFGVDIKGNLIAAVPDGGPTVLMLACTGPVMILLMTMFRRHEARLGQRGEQRSALFL
jgi:hypothetical protein